MVSTPSQKRAVEREVHKLLDGSPAFAQLSPERQSQLKREMANVSAFLAQDPGAWMPPTAQALDNGDPVETLKQNLAAKPKLVGDDFKAGAVREGVDQFGALVKKVDFPKFVSGLVQGVFQAVVDASIQQMEAYGELLSAVSKTVDDFARDNITDAQARDNVRNKYPTLVTLETPSDGPARLRPVGDGDTTDLAKTYGMQTIDLSDDDDELKLVTAAKLEMARSRQQLLATMVLLGINRIVVTNGHINAKVVFDVQATDTARRRNQAALHDATVFTHVDSMGASGGLLGDIFGGPSFSMTDTYSHSTTVESSLDETSTARAQMKANLSGDVNLQFKSETFPLERMVDVLGMQTLNDRATPVTPVGRGARSPAPTPTPPAPPAPATVTK